MKHFIYAFSFLFSTTLLAQQNTSETIEEIVVTAELLEASPLTLPNSVSVIDNNSIESRQAQNLEDLLNLAPNVNFSTGASRGRFIQIRGIGERSEFQEPIINSVGIMVDGIDFTGIATGATTLDLQQVEVLRGPQGTLYGANALAGLINMVSNRPTDEFYAKLGLGIENYNGLQADAVISNRLSDSTAYRLAVKHYQSDGFTDNVFLNRKDTNNIDETSARLRLISQASERLELDFIAFLADINNGYDAFSLDNTRQTYSDKPGVDQQKTTAFSLRANYQLNQALELKSTISTANSDLVYGYDEDWSHTGICNGTACDSSLFGFDWFYASEDNYQRDNQNVSFDSKLVSTANSNLNWVLGLYHRSQQIDLLRRYTYNDADFSSALDTKNTAIYGQIDSQLSNNWSLVAGLRAEKRSIDYADNTAKSADLDENLWGGRIALQYHADSGAFYYSLISRGYKPGGFNLEQDIAPDQRRFDTETMTNFELGFKQSYLNQALQLQAAVFYQSRDDIQSKQSIVRSNATGQTGDPCPCSFTDFTSNAASGSNQGIELELDWQVNERLALYSSLGLLKTRFGQFQSFEHIKANKKQGVAFDLTGREQAHAPNYQLVIGGEYALNDKFTVTGSIEAKDAFFFSERHEETSDSYELLNLALNYQHQAWNVSVYAKNLTDQTIKTRGFGSFGNDPRKFYKLEPYNQFGAPRIVGIKASMEF